MRDRGHKDIVGDPIVTGRDDRLTRADRAVPVSAPAPLLATKLYAPRVSDHLLSRPRLVERLSANVRGPLTLIVAPVSWGKTTLLGEWMGSATGKTWPVGWLSLDARDNDPVRFWTYLLAALNQAHPGVADAALALLRVSQPPALDAALILLLNALTELPTDVVLVLDDFHLIMAEPIHAALAALLDHLPPRLHLVLATREDPRLPLARLRVRGALTELRADDLRFTVEEAATFLTETVGLPLAPEAVATLEARSEGWIAGLQLAALATRGRSSDQIEDFVRHFSGSHRYIVDYLIEEVLGRQSAAIQTFLLRSAVLDRFCAPLCQALLDDGNVATPTDLPGSSVPHAPELKYPGSSKETSAHLILEQLERANLFLIPLDDERRWYRYHHLFADVLRNRLRQLHPELAATLHRHASVWFEAQGLIAEAVEQALAAPNGERAAELIEHHGIAMGIAGSFATVLGWLQALPPMATRPRLDLCHAVMLFLANQPEAAEGCLRSAESAVTRSTEGLEAAEEAADELLDDEVDRAREPATAGLSPIETRTILGMVAALRGEIAAARDNMVGSVRLARQALTLLPESETLWRDTETRSQARAFHVTGDVTSNGERALVDILMALWAEGNVITGMGASSDLAYMHTLRGRLGDAIAVLTEAARRVSEALGVENLVIGPSYFVGVGDVLRERNALDAAEGSLLQGIDLMAKTVIVSARVVVLGYVALAKLHQARGRTADALATLDAIAQVAHERRFMPDICSDIAAVRAQIQLAMGDLATAVRWADAAGLSADDAELPFLREREYLTLARVRIAQGRAATAHRALPAGDRLGGIDRRCW